MIKRHKFKGKGNFISGRIRIVAFFMLSLLALKTGQVGGEALFNLDTTSIEGVEVENFKVAINNMLPIINTVYNSGNINTSFSGEARKLIKGIFGFEINSPVTILSSQSSVFYFYYNNGYKPFMPWAADNDGNGDGKNGPDNGNHKFLEDASSTSYEEDSENREFHEDRVIRNDTGNIAIHNETKYKIDISKMLKEPLKLRTDKKGPKVLIYHTHTSEGYLKSQKEIGAKDIPSFSTNPQYSVVRVGDELAQNLKKKFGIDVIHNGSVHDYPNYNGAYGRSLDTASKILKSYPSINIILDIHRDATGIKDKKLRAVAAIKGKNAARIMFVVGTDQRSGLPHPNWRENLKLAMKLQDRLNQISPGITKPINLSNNRYNQHVAYGALIIEVGGDGNLLEESLESTKYLARAINDVINVD